MLSRFCHLSSSIIRIGCLTVFAAAIVLGSAALCMAASANAASLPSYMDVIAGDQPPLSSEKLANQNLLDLDLAMFGIYDDALAKYQANFMAQHPVIMALFSNQGGKLILYRPGHAPLEAPEVPIRYQIYKSIGHSALAIFELTGSHLGTVSDSSWIMPMRAFRAANQSALDTLDSAGLPSEERRNQAAVLNQNIKFMDNCLSRGTYTFAGIQQYAAAVKPFLEKNITWGATIQVEHWMEVVKGWKGMLGADWRKTYGVSNTLYVARQNNVLFSVLAQFFGKDAMNSRLFLFETSAFVTTPDQMLDVLIRIVSDRSAGEVFFGDYYLMDYELMGGNGRKAIASEDKKYGMPVFLPPLVPFRSTEWPFRIDPSQGEGAALIEQIK
jgi:hypothetical protein